MTNNKINQKSNNLDSNISNIIDNIDSRKGIAFVAGKLLNSLRKYNGVRPRFSYNQKFA
jgi:hypothetical protein|tara:strand:- start:1186 stop:1362 length:177 start_codon:yes stop_codon:yes gene_type:complete